jgi:hypothetical protein
MNIVVKLKKYYNNNFQNDFDDLKVKFYYPKKNKNLFINIKIFFNFIIWIAYISHIIINKSIIRTFINNYFI